MPEDNAKRGIDVSDDAVATFLDSFVSSVAADFADLSVRSGSRSAHPPWGLRNRT